MKMVRAATGSGPYPVVARVQRRLSRAALLCCVLLFAAAGPAFSAPTAQRENPAPPVFLPLAPTETAPNPAAGQQSRQSESPGLLQRVLSGAGGKDAEETEKPAFLPVGPPEKAAPPPPAGPGVPSLPQGVASGLEPRTVELMRRGIVRVEIRPARPMLITAPFSGSLAEMRVHDGETVSPGQVVAVLDPTLARRGLEDARLAMADAIERVQAAQGAQPVEQEAARTRLARAADSLREAEERLERTTLSAPFAGRVTEVRASAGQMLKQGETVAELAEEGDMEIVCTVPSVWVSHVESGHRIWVFVEETAKSYEAEFIRFGGRVDAASRTVRAYARFSSAPAELLPGMSGRADFFPHRPK